MAMIRKNRETVEEIVKLFFCEGKDRRFQIRYLSKGEQIKVIRKGH